MDRRGFLGGAAALMGGALLAGCQGGPATAIALQAAVVLIMLQTLAFDALLTYIGFTLSVSAAITVAGVFVIRHQLSDKARWGYPVLPILFIALSAWVAAQSIWSRPAVSSNRTSMF